MAECEEELKVKRRTLQRDLKLFVEKGLVSEVGTGSTDPDQILSAATVTSCDSHCDRLASALGRHRLVRGDGRDDFGGGALHEVEALKQHSGVTIPEGDVVRARRSGVKADGLANHECAGLGFTRSCASLCLRGAWRGEVARGLPHVLAWQRFQPGTGRVTA